MNIKDNKYADHNVHSHIKGLGIYNDVPEQQKDGLISQLHARNALNIYKNYVKNNKAKHLLILGEPETGKTALALAMLRDSKIKYLNIAGAQLETTEDLIQNMRKTVSVKFKEVINVIEGEVVEIKKERLILKTTEMESEFTLGHGMSEELLKEKVSVGDVIRVIKESGKIKKIGKSFLRSHEYDTVGPDIKFVSCPEGELIKTVENVTYMTLHDLDLANNLNFKNEDIKPETRIEVNKKVQEWVEEETGEIEKGFLLIDEAEMMKPEILKTINYLAKNELSPFFVLTADSNNIDKGFLNCLQNFLIVKTKKLLKEDLIYILKLKIKEEGSLFNEDIVTYMADIGLTKGIKTMINLIGFCYVIVKNDEVLTKNHINDIMKNFK